MLALTPPVLEVLRVLQQWLAQRGAQGFLTGGAVRDALLGRPLSDLDVAVTAPPRAVAESIAQRFAAPCFALDAERGVYRVTLQEQGLTLDLTPLHGDAEQDARRRDFTIDALALPLDALSPGAISVSDVLDATGGLADLQRRSVRAIGGHVFPDDPARLLRGPRIATELGFAIEPATAERIRQEGALLAQVAGERVRDELCRILALPDAAAGLRLLDALALLTRVFPELEASRGCAQPKEHHWDVLQHSIEAVGQAAEALRQAPATLPGIEETPWDDDLQRHFREGIGGGHDRALLLKLAALLHDVAKPATKTIEADGRIRFLGHPKLGAQMSEVILSRLRFSIRETRLIVCMVEEHLRPGLLCRDGEPSRRALYRYFRDAGEAAIATLFLSLADYRAARGPLLEPGDWGQYAAGIRGMLYAWRRQADAAIPEKLVDGHDLMRELGLRPGPQVGALLETVREAQAAGEIASRAEALALAARLLREGLPKPPAPMPE